MATHAENQKPVPSVRGVRAALTRAVVAHEEGRFDEAIAAYNEVLDLIPRQPDALHLLGLIAKSRGEYDEAERLVRAAIASNPRQPHAASHLEMIARLKSARRTSKGAA